MPGIRVKTHLIHSVQRPMRLFGTDVSSKTVHFGPRQMPPFELDINQKSKDMHGNPKTMHHFPKDMHVK